MVFGSLQEMEAALQRDVNCVSDDNPSVRSGALTRLLKALFPEEALGTEALPEGAVTADPSVLRRQYFPVIMKPLLKRFADHSERCRELAVLLTTKFLSLALDFSSALPYVVPALMERAAPRVGFDLDQNEFVADQEANEAKRRGRVVDINPYVHTVVETSEEVRLLLCNLLACICNRTAAIGSEALLTPYLQEFVFALYAFVVDPFPDLRLAGCEVLVALNTRMPDLMKHFAVGFVKALKTGLDHRHSKVRIGTLAAVSSCVMCEDKAKRKGAGTAGIHDLVAFQDPNSVSVAAFYRSDARVNYFAKLSVDGNVTVREHFYTMLGTWMTRLPDRYDFENFLVPYVLSGMGDAAPHVATLCMTIIDSAGRMYEEEHADDLIEKRQYGVDGDTRVDYTRPLPRPFTGRPRLGTRIYVRANARRVMKPLLKELNDWVADTRSKAVTLLCTSLVYLEEHITQDIDELVVTLMRMIHTDDNMIIAARLTGRFVEPDVYIPFLLPAIAGEATSTMVAATEGEGRARALAVCAAMIQESRPSAVLPHVRTIVRALCEPTLLASKLPALQAGAVATAHALATVLVGRMGSAASAMFESTGRVTDLHADISQLLSVLLVALGRLQPDWMGRPGLGEAKPAAVVPAVWAVDDIGSRWLAEARLPTLTLVNQALANLALACAAPSVQDLVVTHSAALVAAASSTYSTHALWAPDAVAHVLLEQTLRVAGPGAWGVVDGVVGIALRVADSSMGPAKRTALLRLSQLLRHVLGQPVGPEGPAAVAGLAPSVPTLLDSFLGLSTGALEWQSSALEWLQLLRALVELPLPKGDAAEAVVCEALAARFDAALGQVTSWTVGGVGTGELRRHAVDTLACILQRLHASPLLSGPSQNTAYVYLLGRLDDASAGVSLAAARALAVLLPEALASDGVEPASGAPPSVLPVHSLWHWVGDLLWFTSNRTFAEDTQDELLGVLCRATAVHPEASQSMLASSPWRLACPVSFSSDGVAAAPVGRASDVEEGDVVEAVRGHVELLLSLRAPA